MNWVEKRVLVRSGLILTKLDHVALIAIDPGNTMREANE
jgi:hypothetical protein